jgi:hypothetical protein
MPFFKNAFIFFDKIFFGIANFFIFGILVDRKTFAVQYGVQNFNIGHRVQNSQI